TGAHALAVCFVLAARPRRGRGHAPEAARRSDPAEIVRLPAHPAPHVVMSREFPIPARLNLLLLAAASIASATLLYVASHATLGWKIAAAVAFSFTANTLFSLLHESVHGLLHPVDRLNRWGGRWAAAF